MNIHFFRLNKSRFDGKTFEIMLIVVVILVLVDVTVNELPL